MKKKRISMILGVILMLGMLAEALAQEADGSARALLPISAARWQYDADSDVYWQVGIAYCADPADSDYETLGIFVPGAYMTATDNGDGSYTCAVNFEGCVGGYTASTAPIVIPVNTPGYAAMRAPTGFVDAAADYAAQGFVYVNAGCRGRDAGAPAGIADLKAAVRFLRYAADGMPGNTERIFTFGMSGGGAQSALMGASGDSALYDPYLAEIGAVMTESDAIAGAMCWCPITNLDMADAAYEWNMGSSRSGLDADAQRLSDGLAAAYADYINALGLTDAEGEILSLTESAEGIFQSGAYYDYLKGVIEESLNHFLSDTAFPYAAGSDMNGIPGDFGEHTGRKDMKRDQMPDGDMPDDPRGLPDGDMPDDLRGLPDGEALRGGFMDGNGQFQPDGIGRMQSGGALTLTGTYETAQDYIDALNADGAWVIYDAASNTATITSIGDFVNRLKVASKSVGAFDDLNGTQGENTLFGYGDGSGAHFDAVMAALLKGTQYEAAYAADLSRVDALGNTVDVRVDMYNPMYYLEDYYEGAGSSSVAPYWRIRTGINQGDTALCTEVNLALALEAEGCAVDFETVWGQGHTQAERTGSATENFIRWVNACLNAENVA